MATTTPASNLLARDWRQLAVVGCGFDGPKSTPRAGADASAISPPTEGVQNLLLLICAIRSAELEHYVEFVPSGQQTRVLVALQNLCVARTLIGFDGVGGGGLLLEGGEDAVNGAEVGLVDDAGLAVDAFGDGDVEVGLAADDILDQGCHGENISNTRVLEIAR